MNGWDTSGEKGLLSIQANIIFSVLLDNLEKRDFPVVPSGNFPSLPFPNHLTPFKALSMNDDFTQTLT